MPRIGRLHVPGGYYHVMGRGIEKRDIFETNADKRDLLDRFGRSIARTQACCLAWAVMSNHYHFLIQVNEQPLSRLMASVLGGFAGSYNRRHNRCGYVFQNRFKSILVEEDSYLLELVRYIHLNPVAAKMLADVDALTRYPWTGHAGMLNKKHREDWHSVNEALLQFGNSLASARRTYLKFICEGRERPHPVSFSGGGVIRSHGSWEDVKRMRQEHISCVGDERILGSSDFVEAALRSDSLATDRALALTKAGWTLTSLANWAANYAGIDPTRLTSKARGGPLSKAKAILCYLGVTELRLSERQLAEFLTITQPSVAAWVKKGEVVCGQNSISLESTNR